METTTKNVWPYLASFFFVFLIGITIYWWAYQNRVYPDILIAQTVHDLGCIFDAIDASAGISGFEHDHNHIDFLTVKSFLGSEVGPMNLIHPKKWAGPYIHDNPTFQEKLYQVVKAKDGYWVMPGNGVRLTNGHIIGTDINITPETKIQSLIDQGILISDSMPLARKIGTGGVSKTCAAKKIQVFSPALFASVEGA